MIITRIDQAISVWVSTLEHTPFTTGVVVAFAEYSVYVVMLGFLFYLFSKKRVPRESVFALWVLVVAFTTRQVFKSLAAMFLLRDRPYLELATTPLVQVFGSESQLSFPSGHTLFLAAIAGAVFYKNRRLGWVLVGVTCLTGLARVFALVHWPSDIVGGLILGLLCGYCSSALFQYIHARHTQYVHEKNSRGQN